MRFLALIGALAIIAAIGAAIYFFGGFYNVAQSADNPAIVDWALASARGASVAAHGTDTPPANLDDAETAKAGARSYSTIGCGNCCCSKRYAWSVGGELFDEPSGSAAWRHATSQGSERCG